MLHVVLHKSLDSLGWILIYISKLWLIQEHKVAKACNEGSGNSD